MIAECQGLRPSWPSKINGKLRAEWLRASNFPADLGILHKLGQLKVLGVQTHPVSRTPSPSAFGRWIKTSRSWPSALQQADRSANVCPLSGVHRTQLFTQNCRNPTIMNVLGWPNTGGMLLEIFRNLLPFYTQSGQTQKPFSIRKLSI